MSRARPPRRVAGILTALALASPCLGAEPAIPPGAPHCALKAPPAAAGAYGTPGGFLLVHPRNDALPADFTGCKSLWVVRGAGDVPLLMRLYFRGGALAVAEGYDGRGGRQPVGVCGVSEPRAECAGMGDNPLTALHLPTWPRACMEQPELAACARDPE